jgi:NAD(P)-dependent dehydrogenase (short-subunit alcohol dehydrogenase family)
MSARLEGKRILITGSATGIGAAMARRFAAEGARIVVHGLDAALANGVAASLGDRGVAHICDLAEPAAAKELVDFAVRQLGGLDGLVNNAAWIPRTNLFNTDAAVFDRCMAINVRAPMLLVQAAFEHLKQSRGAVLNIGSVNAYCGEPNLLPYSLSKGALMTLTRNLADALGTAGVRVNQMNLGWVLSENEDRVQQAMGKSPGWHLQLPKAFAPSGRILRPEEVAAAAVYWMSDESQLVSGTVMELEQFPIIGRNPAKETV